MLILASCLPSSLSLLWQKEALLLSYRPICVLTGFVFNVTARLSVFLIALLSLARAIQLIFPFSARNQKALYYMVPLCVYLFLNVLLASLPLAFSPSSYYYSAMLGQCSWGLNELSFVRSVNSTLWYSITYTTIILPWLVPAVVVLVSCLASVLVLVRSHLLQSRMRREPIIRRITANLSRQAIFKLQTTSTPNINRANRNHESPRDKQTTHATVTIIIMTVVYIIFNVPCWIVYCYLLSTGFNPITWVDMDVVAIILILVSRVSVALNSAVNPIVYMYRMKTLRKELFGQLGIRGWRHAMTKRASFGTGGLHTKSSTGGSMIRFEGREMKSPVSRSRSNTIESF